MSEKKATRALQYIIKSVQHALSAAEMVASKTLGCAGCAGCAAAGEDSGGADGAGVGCAGGGGSVCCAGVTTTCGILSAGFSISFNMATVRPS